MPRRQKQSGVTLMEMLMVVAIIALLAGLTYPMASSGMESLKLRSAGDDVASFLYQAVGGAERRQEPVEITFQKVEGVIMSRGLRPGSERELALPEGIRIMAVLPEPPGPEQPVRSYFLLPGAAFPQLSVVIANKKGNRKLVKLDPVTGAPDVTALENGAQ
jgi:prepilin-type N-terminal cleavage/methylation domain-containing protein